MQSTPITEELYIEENGDAILMKDFWGFCDGQKNFLHIGYNFFEMKRVFGTYEVWGSKTITEKSRDNFVGRSMLSNLGIQPSNNALISKKIKVNSMPLQLDMETGTVY